jgi:DNA-binding GntR family transcriptional regulator
MSGRQPTATDTSAETRNADALIKQWRASFRHVDQIAAALATKIDCGQYHRWEDLPPQSVLADEYDVTERTVTNVKRLLAAHGFLALENGRYHVA